MVVKCTAATCKHYKMGLCTATVIEMKNVEFTYENWSDLEERQCTEDEQFCTSYESGLM